MNAQAPDAKRWSVSQANAWYGDLPWLCGCNFLPSTAVNSTEMWQGASFDPAAIDRELGWAEVIGFNTGRVFLQYLVWEHNAEGLKERIDRFLDIADGHGISTMLILFDDCMQSGREPYLGEQDAPMPSVHNSGWTPSPGHHRVMDRSQWGGFERYVGDIVGTYAHDRRVVAWDLYNEPGAHFPNPDITVPLLEAAFGWARDAGPSQPLTVCVFGNPRHARWQVALERSDVISFHSYANLGTTRQLIDDLERTGRPLLCTEWMARTRGSRIETHLPLFKAKKVGCYTWGLVAGKTQTYYPWGSPYGGPEPEVWFHDLFSQDGTPYSADEIEVIRRHTLPG
jgi:hypothetical protein